MTPKDSKKTKKQYETPVIVAEGATETDKALCDAASLVAGAAIRAAADELDAGVVNEAPEVSAAAAVHDDAAADDMDAADVDLETKVSADTGDVLQIKYLNEVAREMSMLRATAGSAGLDLCACKEGCQRAVNLVPGSVESIPTGVAVAIPKGYCGLVFIRSGKNVNEGLQLSGGAYVIDSDYRGEIMLPLTSNRDFGTLVQPGERVAQLVIVPVMNFPMTVVEELPASERGANGFGSSGN